MEIILLRDEEFLLGMIIEDALLSSYYYALMISFLHFAQYLHAFH